MKTEKIKGNNSTGSEILKKLLIHLDMNPNRFAVSLGMKRAQGIYDILDGTVGISKNMAEKIMAMHPKINYTWLSTGKGEIEKPQKRGVARLIQLFDFLALQTSDSKQIRERLRKVIGGLQEKFALEEIFELLEIKPSDGIYFFTGIKSFSELVANLTTNFGVNQEYINNGKGEIFLEMDDHFIQLNRQQIMVPFLPIGLMVSYANSSGKEAFIEKLPKFALPPKTESSGAKWMYFEMDDDSMEPSIAKHDIIVATQIHKEDWLDIRDLNVYVIVTKEAVLIRRIQKDDGPVWRLVLGKYFDPEPVQLRAIKELWVFRRLITSKMEVVNIPNRELHGL